MPPREDEGSMTDYIPPIIALLFGLGGAYLLYSMWGKEEPKKLMEGCEQYRYPNKKPKEPEPPVKKYR